MAIQIRCLVNPGCILGEGPVWDQHKKVLYWVDILGRTIYRYHPGEQTLRRWTTPEWIGFVVVTGEADTLLAGLKSGLFHLRLLPDGEVAARQIDQISDGCEHIRYNDGMLDCMGRIWACTMDIKGQEPLGSYYCYDQHLNRTRVAEGYVVANGPALSPDGLWLYTVETVGNHRLSKGIYQSMFQPDGSLSDRKLFVGWDSFNSCPDGLITDRFGNLWIGEYGGNVLRSYSPEGELLKAIPLPAWNVTKPAWGGQHGTVLYVTSARADTNEALLAEYPHTGGVLEITDLTVE